MSLPRFLQPNTHPELRPDPEDPAQKDSVTYIRSILWMRVFVGVAGLLLPVALLVVDRYWFHGYPTWRDSMSAYYWSGMRDAFVGVIFGTGAFLISYRIAEVSLDNTASIVAGLGAMCLAWFPTKPQPPSEHPIPVPTLTALQDELGKGTVYGFHIGGTFLFVGGLAIVSFLFGRREGRYPRVNGKRSPKFWQWFHWICTGFMVAGIAWILISSVPHHRFGPRWDVFLGEVTCAWAFGFSWLLKGWEFDTLFHRPVSGRRRDGGGGAARRADRLQQHAGRRDAAALHGERRR
jgi:hypothetical protein